ncbi:MAG: class II glutamine amidotransferase [Polyangiaceae bacterium]|jgi:transglutaminase-like putative cysteine protease/predicted glutamine amidotransferase
MPNLFAMSFEGTLAPSFDLRCLHPGRKPPDGWGIGYYPGGEPSASVLKEPAPESGSIRSEIVKAWDHLASSIFVVHIRTATWGQNSDANTQPFSRAHGGRDWLFGHSGSLRERLVVDGRFEPVGSTDTELVFCDLLNRIADAGWRAIGEVDLVRLRHELEELNQHGSLSLVMSDGQDLLVYADGRDEGSLHLAQLLPPHGPQLAFGDDDLWIELTRRGEISRKGVVISSTPLTREDGGALDWTRIPAGHLLVVRQGAIVSEIGAGPEERRTSQRKLRPVQAAPRRAEPKDFDVVHRTVYRYEKPVERSTHLLRLLPIHDRLQTLREHSLVIKHDGVEIEGKQIEFDDVFGNRARRVVIERPFRELSVEARSKVAVLDSEPLEFKPLHARRAIPLVWMPWQREMMAPYLLPVELPETQLQELADYAMSFVERNDYDLIGTLLDMNRSIYKEYKYSQGTTTVATTAFDVYANRRGVCQDFTNLLICLARLLGVPARYTCGYVYTGPKAENRAQSEASHAWVQLYLPEVGWKGFDPTNGILTQTDHIRIAVGRSYIDATPTSGTIYVGGGAEALTVDVRVELSE